MDVHHAASSGYPQPQPTPRTNWLGALGRASVILACLPGCAHRVPGETFSAGYVFAHKHSRVTHDFVVKNTTSEPVQFLTVQQSCSCTSYKLDKDQLKPGEATKLTMDVIVANAYMHKYATCVLKTNHPTFKDWAYTVEFVSLPLVVTEPNVLNLGSFKADGSDLNAVKHVTLNLFREAKLDLTSDHFTVPEEIS